MDNQTEHLKKLYDSYSDEEMLRIYTSGSLTEKGKGIALREIKSRNLAVPIMVIDGEVNDNQQPDSVQSKMVVIANNLRFDEAIVLSEFMIAEGVPSDIGSTTLQNAFFPSGLSGVVRVPEQHLSQAMPVLEAYYQKPKKAEENNSQEDEKELVELTDEEKKMITEVRRRSNNRGQTTIKQLHLNLVKCKIYTDV